MKGNAETPHAKRERHRDRSDQPSAIEANAGQAAARRSFGDKSERMK
jgi:hypothetical protein